MPNETADALKMVISSAEPALTSAGFRRRRQTFNRRTADGVTQVLSFQLVPVPRARQRSAEPRRRFAILLGLADANGHGDEPPWVNEGDCRIRRRLSELVPLGTDAEPALDDPDGATWATFHLVTMYALPWLDERGQPDQLAG
jgi:hypothetical protein